MQETYSVNVEEMLTPKMYHLIPETVLDISRLHIFPN